MREKGSPVNYLFFGFYFVLVTIVHVLHVGLIEPNLTFSSYFFATYAVAQCALETVLLLILAYAVERQFPRFIHLYVLFAFFFLLSHLIDFPLVRLMDLSFWYGLSFITKESGENFIELLIASNIPIWAWSVAAFLVVGIFFSGILLFRKTAKWSLRRPLHLSFSTLALLLCVLSFFLLAWDHSARKYVAFGKFDRYEKTLPWKHTFFPQKKTYLALSEPLAPRQMEEELLSQLDSRAFALAHNPDIYLFVIESLREDFITAEVTPHLDQFKRDNLSFDLAFSNGNATQISWFSIFHSLFPFHWGTKEVMEGKKGALPLRLLKKMGYKIYVNSSARLNFYQMQRILFGENGYLADHFFTPNEEEFVELYQRDQRTMRELFEGMEGGEGKGGRVFITFLDATHHHYSWPEETGSRFTPYEDGINYLMAAIDSSRLEGVKNRYRNALYFVDGLLGDFFKALDTSTKGKEAVVVIMGDHGEEFYEHGNLFHASSLSHYQMHIPLYYRFGDNRKLMEECKCTLTSQMDIFPSIFHYLLREDLFSGVLEGESIFKAERWPYVVTGRFNASRSPSEFCIHNGSDKLIAEFSEDQDIFNSKGLRILSKKNLADETVANDLHTIQEEYGAALHRLFSR